VIAAASTSFATAIIRNKKICDSDVDRTEIGSVGDRPANIEIARRSCRRLLARHADHAQRIINVNN
jgi:hypothetical protein